MENLKSLYTCLEDLKSQARALASSGVSLAELFDKEANRLSLQDEVSRLETLCNSIRQQLQLTEREENTARSAHYQASYPYSIGGSILSFIAAVSNNKKVSTVSRFVTESIKDNWRSFGNVLISIGPNGFPEDVKVISVSRLARDSGRPESRIINELQGRGYLLFGEGYFSLIVEKLIGEVRAGRLHLPVSSKQLPQIVLKPTWIPIGRKPE